ncbi:MAG: OmpA family protein [Pseudomonadota bacterium]
MQARQQDTPLLPRRAFAAAGLSAVFAAASVSLAVWGGMSVSESSSFQFSRGTSLASGEEERMRGLLTRALPDERVHVTILGHTGTAGDAAANLALSQERAALASDLAQVMGISPDRITAQGVGGAAPLSRDSGESDRAYQARLARVDVSLQLRR